MNKLKTHFNLHNRVFVGIDKSSDVYKIVSGSFLYTSKVKVDDSLSLEQVCDLLIKDDSELDYSGIIVELKDCIEQRKTKTGYISSGGYMFTDETLEQMQDTLSKFY